MTHTSMHTVRHGVHEGEEVADVEVTRTYDGTVEEVWDALTGSERLPRWFAPVTGDLRQGGRFQIEGNASGTVKECFPPRGFTITWEFAGATSTVTAEVAEVSENRTVVRISHRCPTDDDHWRRFGPSAVGLGWDLAVEGLAMHLAADGADVSAEGEAWMTSPDGADHLRRCGSSWEQADVRGGEDPSRAAERAAASVEAFTAPPA